MSARTCIFAPTLILSMLTANSLAAQPFAINTANLQAAKPHNESLISVTAAPSVAKIVAYTTANKPVANLIQNLSKAGAGKVDLLEIKMVNACGKKLMRAEIRLEGDNSKLPAQSPDITMMQDGKKFRSAGEGAAK
ncbi:hypothetical protein [Undibacterium sp. YM2]|jgi:hypothetical protein|uniref:hypothetical protein n=1 Tax=Undibacterium sp. YM2 TaxID=2058625 RepID=UPI001389C001|nr:hypothetical protein [Undibacterium sp. YM2]